MLEERKKQDKAIWTSFDDAAALIQIFPNKQYGVSLDMMTYRLQVTESRCYWCTKVRAPFDTRRHNLCRGSDRLIGPSNKYEHFLRE